MMIAVAVLMMPGSVSQALAVGTETLSARKRSIQTGIQDFIDTARHPDNLFDSHLVEKTLSPLSHSSGYDDLYAVLMKEGRNSAGSVSRILNFGTAGYLTVLKIYKSVGWAAPEVRCHISSFG